MSISLHPSGSTSFDFSERLDRNGKPKHYNFLRPVSETREKWKNSFYFLILIHSFHFFSFQSNGRLEMILKFNGKVEENLKLMVFSICLDHAIISATNPDLTKKVERLYNV